MTSVLVRVRQFWRDHIAGPSLRTYEQACEELGGVPWRPATETDRWFIGGNRPDTLSQRLPSIEKLPLLDTGAINLKRSMSDGTKLLFIGAGAISAIALVAVLLSGGTPAAASTITAPATASPTAAAAPTVTAAATASASPTAAAQAKATAPLATAPTATAWAPSPSVQSLFSAHPRIAKKHVAARHRRK